LDILTESSDGDDGPGVSDESGLTVFGTRAGNQQGNESDLEYIEDTKCQ
jgi:hypothetical protein